MAVTNTTTGNISELCKGLLYSIYGSICAESVTNKLSISVSQTLNVNVLRMEDK